MTIDNWITTGIAAGNLLMAGATACLAYYTWRLARSTAAAVQQASRHHQENLRPFCVIEFLDPDDQHPFGKEFEPRPPFGADVYAPPKSCISVTGKIRNKGKGLAKDVVVYLNARRGEGESAVYRLTRPVALSGAVGAEETIPIDAPIADRDVIRVWNGTGWNLAQPFDAVASDTYEIVLQYTDIFGSFFRTVHPRGVWHNPAAELAGVGDKAVRDEMMSRPTKAMPIFLGGKQSVRTLADFPSPQLAPDTSPKSEEVSSAG